MLNSWQSGWVLPFIDHKSPKTGEELLRKIELLQSWLNRSLIVAYYEVERVFHCDLHFFLSFLHSLYLVNHLLFWFSLQPQNGWHFADLLHQIQLKLITDQHKCFHPQVDQLLGDSHRQPNFLLILSPFDQLIKKNQTITIRANIVDNVFEVVEFKLEVTQIGLNVFIQVYFTQQSWEKVGAESWGRDIATYLGQHRQVPYRVEKVQLLIGICLFFNHNYLFLLVNSQVNWIWYLELILVRPNCLESLHNQSSISIFDFRPTESNPLIVLDKLNKG